MVGGLLKTPEDRKGGTPEEVHEFFGTLPSAGAQQKNCPTHQASSRGLV